MDALDLTQAEFCSRFDLSRTELCSIRRGDPVAAEVALRLVGALDWSSSDIDTFLAEIGQIPAKNGVKIVHARGKGDEEMTVAVTTEPREETNHKSVRFYAPIVIP